MQGRQSMLSSHKISSLNQLANQIENPNNQAMSVLNILFDNRITMYKHKRVQSNQIPLTYIQEDEEPSPKKKQNELLNYQNERTKSYDTDTLLKVAGNGIIEAFNVINTSSQKTAVTLKQKSDSQAFHSKEISLFDESGNSFSSSDKNSQGNHQKFNIQFFGANKVNSPRKLENRNSPKKIDQKNITEINRSTRKKSIIIIDVNGCTKQQSMKDITTMNQPEDFLTMNMLQQKIWSRLILLKQKQINEACILTVIANNSLEEFEFKVDVSNLPYFWDVKQLTELLNRTYLEQRENITVRSPVLSILIGKIKTQRLDTEMKLFEVINLILNGVQYIVLEEQRIF